MELTKQIIIAFAVIYAPAVLCCNPGKLATECMAGLSELSTLSADAHGNKEALQTLCNTLTTMNACIQKYTAGCSPDVQKQLAMYESQLGSFAGMCDPNNDCNMMKFQECFTGLPMGAEDPSSINYQEVCMKFPMASKCATEKSANCQDPNLKKNMQMSLQMLPMVDGQCKQMYGENYAVTMKQGGSQDSSSDDGGAKEGTEMGHGGAKGGDTSTNGAQEGTEGTKTSDGGKNGVDKMTVLSFPLLLLSLVAVRLGM